SAPAIGPIGPGMGAGSIDTAMSDPSADAPRLTRRVVSERLTIPVGAQAVLLFDHVFVDGERLIATIETEDALPADDTAALEAHFPGPTRVAVVGEEEYFLRQALAADLFVDVTHWLRWEPGARFADYDLYIFNHEPLPPGFVGKALRWRSEEHTSELQSR